MKKPLSIMWLGLRGFPNVQGGVETHAEHLCPQLAELGCNITVIVRSSYQTKAVGSEWKNVRFKALWSPRSKNFEAIIHTFLGVLYAAIKRPDILHIQAIGPALFTPLARLLGLKVVVTHHGADYQRQKWGSLAKYTLRVGEYCGMRFSNQRIAISTTIRQLVHEKHEQDCVLIPNGVDIPELSSTATSLERFTLQPQRYILLVSRFVPEKRHHDLIQAFTHAALDGWKLVFVGEINLHDRYTRSVLDAAKATTDVVFAGYQTGLTLRELYQHAGFFVLPSSHEGLPIALLEAMSYGLPVVASNIPAHQEIDCQDIDYFPIGNIAALATLLQKKAAAKQEKMMSDRLRQFVITHYQWSDVAQRTFDIYKNLLANHDHVKPADTSLKELQRR